MVLKDLVLTAFNQATKKISDRKYLLIFCIFNTLMLIWVVNITNHLSDEKLDSDIVGAERFGLALIIAAWIACDILAGLAALISMFVKRKNQPK